MAFSPAEIRERVGDVDAAEFDVVRITDHEKVAVEPNSVAYGRTTHGPMVIFNFNKYHSGLPPWPSVERMTLYGDSVAEFRAINHNETLVTGDLKSVHMISRAVKLTEDGPREPRDTSDYRVDGDVY